MGTNYIAPTWRMPENTNKDKLSNYSINWDNTDQSIVTIPLEDFGIDNTFSFSLWVKPGSGVTPTSYGHLFANAALNSGGFGLYMAGNGNDAGTTGDLCFRFYVDNYNVSGRFINSDPINLEQWYHVAVSYSDATGVSMYVDNASPITGVSGRTAAAPNVPITIGSASNPVYGPRYQCKSSISQVCLFDYIISDSQVEYLYNLNNPMIIPGGEPVGYFPVGDNSSPTSLACQPNISVGADSVFDFNGSNNYIDLNFQSQTTPATISIWVNTNVNDSQQRYAIINGRADQEPVVYLRMQSNNTYQVFISNTNGFDTLQASSATINTWFHFAIVCENSQTLLYENGVLKDSSTIGWNGINIDQSNNWQLGRDSRGQRYWNGKISNVQFWDTDLQDSDIATLYNNGQPLMSGTQPQASNLKSWYKLNQTDSYWDIGETGKWTFNNAAIN